MAGEMLQRVGLVERICDYLKMLSGVEQQLVALLRALVLQRSVLLAD